MPPDTGTKVSIVDPGYRTIDGGADVDAVYIRLAERHRGAKRAGMFRSSHHVLRSMPARGLPQHLVKAATTTGEASPSARSS